MWRSSRPGPSRGRGGRLACALLSLLAAANLAAEAGTRAVSGSQAANPPRPRQAAQKAAESFESLRANADSARTAGRLDEAAALYARAVTLRPAWTEGYWYLGTTQYEREQYRAARDAFAVVVARQAANGAAWALKGLCEFQAGTYSAALRDLTRGVDLGTGDDPRLAAVARYHRAILLTRFGQYERSLRLLAGFASGGRGPELTHAMGLAALRISKLPHELSAAEREVVILAGHAALLSAASDRDGSRRAFDDLARRYPGTPNVHYLRGLSLLRDDPDAALEAFHAEVQRAPDHAPAMVQLAQELLKRGDHAAAAEWASRAARQAPHSFAARRALGQVKLQQGDVTAAIAELEAAVRLEPTSPSARFSLARAYQRAGRRADAQRERAEFSRLERLQRVERGGANAVGEPELQQEDPEPPQPR